MHAALNVVNLRPCILMKAALLSPLDKKFVAEIFAGNDSER
jgi:hypothetical protein